MSTKHLGNFTTNNNFIGDVSFDDGLLIVNRQPLNFPTNIGVAGSVMTSSGSGNLTWNLPYLHGLFDTDITGLQTADYLRFDGSKWRNYQIHASDVGLENVTNESKSTMFSNPVFTGQTTISGQKFPVQAGLNNQFLKTDAQGNTSWAVPKINELEEVKCASSAAGDYLRYDGTRWTNSPFRYSTTEVSSSYYEVLPTDCIVSVTYSGNSTVFLPAVNTVKGQPIVIYKLSQTGQVNVVPRAGENIETEQQIVLVDSDSKVQLVSNGSTAYPRWYRTCWFL